MKPNRNFRNVSTKVDANSWELFNRLCKLRGMTPYELLQMVVDTLIRYMDDRHQLTGDMETVINLFENLQGWKESFNICDPTAEPTISEATYYMVDDKGHTGTRAILVSKPFMGLPQMTYNVQTIAERMFCLVFPDLYRRLRVVGVTLDTTSAVETIERMVQDVMLADDDRTLAEMFSDNSYSEHARRPHEGEPYVRHKVRNMEQLFGDDSSVTGGSRDEEEQVESVGSAYDLERMEDEAEKEEE